MKIGKKLLTIGAGTFILLLVGLYNGYPLVYSDTGTYIYSGFNKFIPVDRPITYGLFIKFFSFNYSLWFVIIVQNLIVAYVMYEVLKVMIHSRTHFTQMYLSIMAFLVFFTGLAWYTNQIMPDFFSSVSILVIYALLTGQIKNIFVKIIFQLILIFSLITHFSHLLIASVLLVTILIIRLLLKEKLQQISLGKILMISIIILLSWIILPSINYTIERKFILSKGSHVFLMAHLNDAGILSQFLDENCAKSEFKDCRLCQYKDSLPKDLASFIWAGKILENTGGWEGSKDEYERIIKETLKRPRYLAENIYVSFYYGLIQLTRNEIGQGLSSYAKGSPPYDQISWRFHRELNSYLMSRQNIWNGAGLNLKYLNLTQLFLLICSFFFLIYIFSTPVIRKLEKNSATFLIFIILAITINSFITAGLNSPCERFQARVIWMLPFALIILIYKNFGLFIKRS